MISSIESKTHISKFLDKYEPKNFVFSHPVAGSHKSGYENSYKDFFDQKKLSLSNNLDLKTLQSKKIIAKKYEKLKILGQGEIKNKINLSVNFVSKQAKEKIEKIGGKLTLIKN